MTVINLVPRERSFARPNRRRKIFNSVPAVALVLLLTGCGGPQPVSNSESWCAAGQGAVPKVLDFELVARFTHRDDAYTQGLLFDEGYIYESTGRYGHSTLSRYRPGEPEQMLVQLPADRFGEGLAKHAGIFYLLTWKSGEVLRYSLADGGDSKTPRPEALRPLRIEGEGWGLASDGTQLWASDGSATLRARDTDMQELRRLHVTAAGRPVQRLNELEWVNGCLVANLWRSDQLVVIDPGSGAVSHTLDLSPIANRERGDGGEVTNGIAYRSDNGNWLVTGKNWRYLYEIAPRI